MLRVKALTLWTPLLALLWAGLILRADDKIQVPEGYKLVHLPSGMQIFVKKDADPLANVHSSSPTDKYAPMRLFSSTDPMANKTFSPTSSSFSKGDSPLDHEKSTFVTQSYRGLPRADSAASGFNTKFTLPAPAADSHHDSDFNRAFITPASTLEKPTRYAADKASEEQGRTALLPAGKTDVFASPLASKQYLGEGAQKVPKRAEIKDNITMDSLPDRPLTVDEVRNLINHGVVPDTNEKPGLSSKALNDPDYQPEVSPDPPATQAQPPTAEYEKDFPLPAPGTMAQPPAENTETLPQR